MAVQSLTTATPAHSVPGAMEAVVASLSAVEGASFWGLSGEQVEALVGSVAAIRAVLDRLEVAAVREGVSRGLPAERGYGAVDWVRSCQQRGGGAAVSDPGHISRVLRLTATRDRAGARAVWEAFTAGHLGSGKADQLARFETEVSPVAVPEQVAEVVTDLVHAAVDGADGTGLTPRELSTAIRYAGQLMRPERDLDAAHAARARGRGLTKRPGPAGLAEYRFLADPDAAAILDAAVAGLSAPVTGPHGEPDLRTPARRRGDALIDVIRRGVSAPGAGPRTSKAQVLVTMTLDQLRHDLPGAGVTATGEVLSATEVRRHACDAGIIPVVLGSRGEILDLGAEVRLFTPAQRRALWHRDRGCTYPGCTIPAQWCDAHHVTWWSRGGPTDLGNAALLCGHHHTLVHHRDLTATVTPTAVTWDLTQNSGSPP
ncbi:DUF222 domain-containing protein [Luteipulveratus sp. YIM 133132]|uniref:HNH endonuclease signature motif containing protein n=1 Tax=Luteipulveratus flavus TaxID=3031728 RepID=UPI0023B0E4D5|nr:HNH endonuclease signature motif containing protein [Luteipulveratus sp. YIM 133132]MDE9365721.1 DUF222 domain-containing protein [Luteipulveratus sp. YIM 133132]